MIDVSQMDAAQKAVHDSIAGLRGRVGGPFLPLLHSPALASRVEQMGAYVRYECAVPQRLRELAILVVARHWQADYEWFVHAPIALAQGLPEDAVAALGAGEPANFSDEADRAVADFCSELLATREVSRETYERTLGLLGTRGVTDLAGLVGYYTLLALTLNAHEVEVDDTSGIPWRQGAARAGA